MASVHHSLASAAAADANCNGHNINGALLPTKICSDQPVRRSGNYMATLWTDSYVQSLSSVYAGEAYAKRAQKLKEEVKKVLDGTNGILEQLELIDVMERLGISYHFGEEIEKILETIFNEKLNNTNNIVPEEKDLYATALGFRILRQHGYKVPQEVFTCFLEKNGGFKESLGKDVMGILSLYDASYLSVENEGVLELARDFATKHLKESLKKHNIDPAIAQEVNHALEVPRHWRMLRLETRWFIDVYERKPCMNPVLLEFAKLDFNILQAKYQEEVKEVSTWYENTRIAGKLNFVRDRLVEGYLWTVGFSFEPWYSYCRKILAKQAVHITAVDDCYDVYGTPDELELFTQVVERWDINAIQQLPDYMKICFVALFNCVNEMAYDVLKEHGINTLPHLKRAWAELCRTYLVEARWYHGGHTPTLKEYLDNAWISISGPLLLVFAFFSIANPDKESIEALYPYPDMIKYQSLILRLADDLGTSPDEMKKGDVPKSMQCYMHETGASEEAARNHITHLIGEAWKKINQEMFKKTPFPKEFINAVMNLARISLCMYQFGDGVGSPDRETRDRILSLIVEPIPMDHS